MFGFGMVLVWFGMNLGLVYDFSIVLLGVVYGLGRAWCLVLVWFW